MDHRVGIDVNVNGGGDVRPDNDVPAPPPVVDKPVTPVLAEVVPPPAQPVAVPSPAPTTVDEDSVINDVLDMMFPNGFKAKHLPLIDAWRKATIDLMREIGS